MDKEHGSKIVGNKEFVELDKTLHDRDLFNCDEKQLNDFLHKFAAKHMQTGISRTMLLPAKNPLENGKVSICAFYSIAPGSINRNNLPASLSKKLPHYPVPVFLLAQLAVDRQFQSQGLGKITLLCALKHLYEVSLHMKSYAVVVDCLNDKAKIFYSKYGFEELHEQNGKLKMFLSMNTISGLF
jgi:GNAT superfamily N-acetyltransferase